METITDSAVIIYQMGKVGSTTIHQSLEKAGLLLPIYKVHFLSDEGVKHGEEFHQKTLKKPWESTPHIQTSHFLRDKIRSDEPIQWKIITLVREPIRREISEFFQYLPSLYPELLDAEGNLEKSRALRVLQTKFMFYKPETNYTCRWFDMEVKSMFGLDVYEYPFDTEAGYSIIHHHNVDLLILRLEDLDQTFNRAINEFLEVDTPIEMVKANLRAEQKRGSLYQQIEQDFTIRASLCQKIYSSKYATHFYAAAEIAQFIQKWSGEAGNPYAPTT